MSRSSLCVRAAELADLPILVEFGRELHEQLVGPAEPGARTRGEKPERTAWEQRYRQAIEDPDRHLVLCLRAGEEALGMALLTVAPGGALLDQSVVYLSHALVPGRHRRRGAGKALVAAAADFADARGLEQIVVAVHAGAAGSREANRFFARLGFAPLSVRRVGSVATVRRRLVEVRVPVHADPPVRKDVRRVVRRRTADARGRVPGAVP